MTAVREYIRPSPCSGVNRIPWRNDSDSADIAQTDAAPLRDTEDTPAMMINCAVYADGKRQADIAIDELPRMLANSDSPGLR